MNGRPGDLQKKSASYLASGFQSKKNIFFHRSVVTSAIAVGEKLPDSQLSYFQKEGDLEVVSVKTLTEVKIDMRGKCIPIKPYMRMSQWLPV